MKMTNSEYAKYVDKKSPPSPLWTNLCKAFLSGGVICAIGQGLLNFYKAAGLTRQLSASAVSITLVLLGAVLTGVGVYDDMAKFSGAGTLVPITGFANSVVAPALEFKSEGFVLGMSAKLFAIAGPVLVFGLAASVIYGALLLIL